MTALIWAIRDCLARIRASASLILPRHTWRAALLCVLLAGLLFAAAVIAPAYAESGADKPARYTINVEPGSALNFRAGPSTEAEILYQLGPGNTVTVHETSGDWALVTWTVLEPLDDPRPAWVCMEYLQPVEADAPTPAPENPTGKATPMRSTP